MIEEFKNIEIFDDKTVSDLLKDIYEKTTDKSDDIKQVILKISSYVNTQDDLLMLMPMIKDYLDLSIKNDKQLIDLGNLVQKLSSPSKANNNGDGNSDLYLSEKDKEMLRKRAEDIINNNKELSNDFDSISKDISKKINGL